MVKSSSTAGPEGLFLDPNTEKWVVGAQLGTGACGFVHKLHRNRDGDNSSGKSYAVKLAPIPASASSSKKSKRKKTMAERNADTLMYENTLYRNVLNDLRGSAIPDVPIVGGPVGFGDIDGYRFLVMERMEAPFESIVPLLCKSSPKEINLGPIAVSIISLIQRMHETHHVFVDVKPENFMLSYNSSTKKKARSSSSSSSTALASRLRMIDFGLVESLKDLTLNKHRADEHPDACMVGTPLYASCHVLDGHSVSRRDDMEACGYVICELVLQLMEFHKSGTVKENLLPWSKGKSDEDILNKKRTAVFPKDNVYKNNEDAVGSFWESLSQGQGNKKNVMGVLKHYLDTVSNLKFKEKPDYEGLKIILGQLVVSFGVGKEKSKRQNEKIDKSAAVPEKRRRTRRTSPPVEVVEISSKEDDNDHLKPAKIEKPKRTTRTSARAALSVESSSDDNSKNNPMTRGRTTRLSARKPSSTNINNEKNMSDGNKLESHKRKDPPSKTSRSLVEAGAASRKSKSRKKRVTRIERITTTVELIDSSEDEDEDKDEFEDFAETRQIETFENEDSDEEMKSAAEYKSDNESLQSFHTSSPDAVEIFDEDVVPMDIDFMDKENDETALNSSASAQEIKKSSSAKRTRARKGSNGSTEASEIVAKSLALKLDCIEGPHEGESIFLDDTLTFGSNPRAQKKYQLDKDDDVASSHAKLALTTSGSKGKSTVLSVRVTDLKSGNGTFINGKEIPKGAGRQAFVGNKIQIGESVFQVKKV